MESYTRIALFGMLAAFGLREKADRIRFVRACGFDVDSFTKLSEGQAQFVCVCLEALGPPEPRV